ncbi:MAG: hypothetical protein ACOYOK_08960 [Pseudobdellovibrionaceae bacterium]
MVFKTNELEDKKLNLAIDYFFEKYFFEEKDQKFSKNFENDAKVLFFDRVFRRHHVGNDPVNWIDPTGLYWFRQGWQEPGRVGRPNTIVPPQGPVSNFIERFVPAGYTFGESHDSFVDWAKSKGVPDVLANIPSMIPLYVYSVGLETSRSLGLASHPEPVCK